MFDAQGTKDKLGVLWTWDDAARGGVFKVLPAQTVLQTVPMMPHFKTGTVEYSMAIGMHENPFALDSRARPRRSRTANVVTRAENCYISPF